MDVKICSIITFLNASQLSAPKFTPLKKVVVLPKDNCQPVEVDSADPVGHLSYGGQRLEAQALDRIVEEGLHSYCLKYIGSEKFVV